MMKTHPRMAGELERALAAGINRLPLKNWELLHRYQVPGGRSLSEKMI